MKLAEALEDAIAWVTLDDTDEERGGVIVVAGEHPKNRFRFIPLRNYNEGTDTAKVLWTADRMEYGKIVCPMFRKGWRQYASFHSHPRFPAMPSHTDLTKLFPGFGINYIYSCTDHQLGIYAKKDGKLLGFLRDIPHAQNH